MSTTPRLRACWSLALVLVATMISSCSKGPSEQPDAAQSSGPSAAAPRSGHKNAEYSIVGQSVRLVEGVAETAAAPGSAAKIVTRYFGNEVWRDFNADGREDVAFLVTQETGGSGTFFYAVAAFDLESGFVGSPAVLLGDRIAPQTTELRPDGIVVVAYADHAPGESLSAPPSVAKTIWLKVDPTTPQLAEVEQNFEGEADPARMTLDMKPWVWVRADYSDGTRVAPRQPGAFTLTLRADGTFSSTTDCNRVNGAYSTRGRELAFGDMAATRMFCDGSQESAFTELLAKTSGYFFTSRGELVLELALDSGSVVFR